jgi:hypothetical protein
LGNTDPSTVVEEEGVTGIDDSVLAVLNNRTLSEEEKCFLYFGIAQRGLYKKDPDFHRVQFTFDVQEDLTHPNRMQCTVERVKDKVKKRGRVQKVVLAILGPLIGAAFSVYLRSWCLPTA